MSVYTQQDIDALDRALLTATPITSTTSAPEVAISDTPSDLDDLIRHAERMMEIHDSAPVITPQVQSSPVSTEVKQDIKIPKFREELVFSYDYPSSLSTYYPDSKLSDYNDLYYFKIGDRVSINPEYIKDQDVSDIFSKKLSKPKYRPSDIPCGSIFNYEDLDTIINITDDDIILGDGNKLRIQSCLIMCDDVEIEFYNYCLLPQVAKPVDNIEKALQEEDIVHLNSLLAEVYPEDRFSINSINKDNLNFIDIIIHFPEITITNSKRMSHTIRDLYVKIGMSWSSKDKKYFYSSRFQGARTTLTCGEYNSSYGHSHLSRDAGNRAGYNSFCIGSDHLAVTLGELKIDRKDEKVLELLYAIDDYVRWESLEGGPYITMQNINSSQRADNPILSDDYKNSIIKYICSKYDNFELSFKENLNNVEVNFSEDDLENKIKYLLNNDPNCPKDILKLSTYKIDGSYYKNNIKSSNISELLKQYKSRTEQNVSSVNRVYFKGVEVPLKIIEIKSDDAKKELYLNPFVLEKIQNYLNKKLTKLYNEP